MALLSKCAKLNKGAFITLVLYRPVNGRLIKFICQLIPNTEDNTVFQLSANARNRFERSSGNLPPFSTAYDDFSAK
jgi:hypothetical protein